MPLTRVRRPPTQPSSVAPNGHLSSRRRAIDILANWHRLALASSAWERRSRPTLLFLVGASDEAAINRLAFVQEPNNDPLGSLGARQSAGQPSGPLTGSSKSNLRSGGRTGNCIMVPPCFGRLHTYSSSLVVELELGPLRLLMTACQGFSG